MSKRKQTPHDKFFKKVFSNVKVTEEYLRHFLPKDIAQKLNYARLELQTNSYITDDLRAYYSDIVYSCPYGKKGDQVFVSLLLEHKSQPEKYPYLQLLRYMLAIWIQQMENGEDLRVVIPVIFYHGKKKWRQKPFEEAFNIRDEYLRKYLPIFEYHLTNLSKYNEEDLQNIQLDFLLKALLAMKHASNKKYIIEKLTVLVEIEESAPADNLKRALLVYLLKITEFSRTKLETVIEDASLDTKSFIMSTYDLIMEEGIAKGIVKGAAQERAKFEEEQRTAIIKSITSGLLSLSQIAEILNVPLELVQKVKEDLDK